MPRCSSRGSPLLSRGSPLLTLAKMSYGPAHHSLCLELLLPTLARSVHPAPAYPVGDASLYDTPRRRVRGKVRHRGMQPRRELLSRQTIEGVELGSCAMLEEDHRVPELVTPFGNAKGEHEALYKVVGLQSGEVRRRGSAMPRVELVVGDTRGVRGMHHSEHGGGARDTQLLKHV